MGLNPVFHLRMRDRHAHFFGFRTFPRLGIYGGDHITISLRRLHRRILEARGIRTRQLCVGIDSIRPAIYVVACCPQSVIPVECNLVRPRRFSRLLALRFMEAPAQNKHASNCDHHYRQTFNECHSASRLGLISSLSTIRSNFSEPMIVELTRPSLTISVSPVT